MNARSALFDLYGDHLMARGGVAPIAAVVQLMAPLDISAPAVRTAVSRMVSQGWLEPTRLAAGPGYRVTPRAERRLRDAAQRIYRGAEQPWDGAWHLVSLDRIPERARRDRVRGGLAYLGYAPLRDETWVSPHASPELDGLLAAEKVGSRRFAARFEGADAELAAAAWDLDALAAAYTRWLADAERAAAALPSAPSDQEAFVARTGLVHEWRKFLFSDPGLPRDLLPADWPGDAAADFFDAQASRLSPGASRYVEACLATS